MIFLHFLRFFCKFLTQSMWKCILEISCVWLCLVLQFLHVLDHMIFLHFLRILLEQETRPNNAKHPSIAPANSYHQKCCKMIPISSIFPFIGGPSQPSAQDSLGWSHHLGSVPLPGPKFHFNIEGCTLLGLHGEMQSSWDAPVHGNTHDSWRAPLRHRVCLTACTTSLEGTFRTC